MTEDHRPGVDVVLASDAERDEVAARLGQAAGEGRLTLEEFSDRVGRVYAARTRAELEPPVADLPAAGTPAAPVQPGQTRWRVSPIGGMSRRGPWRLPRRTVSVTLVGGVDLDLREAELSAAEVELTTVSLVGGVSLRVPPGVRVEIDGFSLLGGQRVELPRPAPGAPVLHLRCFSLIGGVSIRATR